MIQSKHVLYDILSKSLTSLEEAITLNFPLFIKNKKGEYVYISESLLEDKNIKLYEFLQKDEEKIPYNLQWLQNDIKIFEDKEPRDRVFNIEGEIYRIVKFLLSEEYILGLAINITEARNVENQDYLLSRILEHLSYSVLVAENKPEEDYPIVFVNQEFTNLTGYSFEDVTGKNCRLLQGSDSSSQFKEGLKKALKEGREYSGVVKNYKKSGAPFWNKVNIRPIYDQDSKQLTHFLGIQREVGYPPVAEMPLNQIYDGLPTLLFVLDKDFKVKDINKFALDYLDYEEEDVIDKKFIDFLYGNSIEAFSKLSTNLKIKGILLNEKITLQKRSGEYCEFILSAKESSVEYISYILLLIESTDDTRSIQDFPESTPWYVQLLLGFYFKLTDNKTPHPVKAAILFLLALLPFGGFVGYEIFLAEDYGSLMSRESFIKSEDVLWEIKRVINPYFYTIEKRDKIKSLLRSVKDDLGAQRVVMRIYEDRSSARLLFDLYNSGPKITPIPQSAWVVDLNREEGYQNLPLAFSVERCVVRERKSLDYTSLLYENLAANNVNVVVSCSDSGNNYFYLSLDFNRELDDEEKADVKEKLITTANQVEDILLGPSINQVIN